MKSAKFSSKHFPISAKLILITSSIFLFSLGGITALTSWLMAEDIRITAEDHNYEVNRLAASRTEETLRNLQINTNLILNLLEETEVAERIAAWFFEDRRDIAAVAFFAGPDPEALLLNESFLLEYGFDNSDIQDWIADECAAALRAANGEIILLNPSSALEASLCAFFFFKQKTA